MLYMNMVHNDVSNTHGLVQPQGPVTPNRDTTSHTRPRPAFDPANPNPHLSPFFQLSASHILLAPPCKQPLSTRRHMAIKSFFFSCHAIGAGSNATHGCGWRHKNHMSSLPSLANGVHMSAPSTRLSARIYTPACICCNPLTSCRP